jgi:hypothetical protein
MTFRVSHRAKAELHLQYICKPAVKNLGGQHQARAALPSGIAQYPLYRRVLFTNRKRKFQQCRRLELGLSWSCNTLSIVLKMYLAKRVS